MEEHRLTEEYRLLTEGDDIVVFDGVKLAEASTYDRQVDGHVGRRALRWTEIHLYRTAGGTYIIHKIGRSDVYHRIDGECDYGEIMPAEEVDDEHDILLPCPVCRPAPLVLAGPGERLRVEVDRYTLAQAGSPEELVRACHTSGPNDSLYLTKVARDALDQASRLDDGVREKFKVRRVA